MSTPTFLPFPNTCKAWPNENPQLTLKQELEALNKTTLPLQQGLSQSSAVGPSPFQAMVLGMRDDAQQIFARAAVFYTGIIAGCNCADDPSPIDENNEYCEIDIVIDKKSTTGLISLTRN